MAATGDFISNCTAVFEGVRGPGADIMDETGFRLVLGKLGVDSATADVAIRDIGDGQKVSFRKFLEWCVAGAATLPRGLQLMGSLHSTLDFDDSQPVPRKLVEDILEVARGLPSSANTQPWTIIVTQGGLRDRLSQQLQSSDESSAAQYAHCPETMTSSMQRASDEYQKRFTEQLGALSAGKGEREFYGAPVQLILCCPLLQASEEAVDGIFLDMGTLLTAILMGAHSSGLGGDVQFSMARHHAACRSVLGEQLPEDLLVVCGLSLGWAAAGRDPRVEPTFRLERRSCNDFARWASCDQAWLAGSEPAASGGPQQDLLELIKSRHCSHTLETARPVPKAVVAAILDAACRVPSFKNSQPWSVTVVQGAARDRLSARMLEEFEAFCTSGDAGRGGKHTYKKYSANNTARMQKGKDTYGFELYEQRHGLARDDAKGRQAKYRPNYEFWGAPVLLLLNLPSNAAGGTFVDIGSFMYAILVAMHSFGLGGKPLGSVAKYTHLCREVLGDAGMPTDEHLICGLAIGWPTEGRDPRVTPDFFPSRLSMEEVTTWASDAAWTA